MNIVTKQVDVLAKRVMAFQLVAAALAAVVELLLDRGIWSALSAICGGLISLVVVLLLRRGVRRASDLALVDQKKSMMILYFGAVQRFLVVVALFALGFGVLGFVPTAMFAGFVAAQVGNFFSVRLR